MTASNFLACFNETASFEGGYSDNLHDPGGATMAGVTQAVYTAWLAKHGRPNAAVKGISLADREAIYREEYWNAVQADDLYAGLDLVMVDTAWGSGPVQAIKLLQGALGIPNMDGLFGAQTLAALQSVSLSRQTALIDSVCSRRMTFFKSLSTWEYFGKGWTVRLNGVQAKALAMNAAALKAAAPAAPPSIPIVGSTPVNQPAPSPAERLNTIQGTLDKIQPTPAHEPWLTRLEVLVKEVL